MNVYGAKLTITGTVHPIAITYLKHDNTPQSIQCTWVGSVGP